MFLEELKQIVSGGQSEALEFKQSTGQCKEAAKSVCALLNYQGGFVIFGVTDKGIPVGQVDKGRKVDQRSFSSFWKGGESLF